MGDICKNSGVTRYTVHAMRATAITAMSDAGLTDRNIMFMSVYKCEESLKYYCRRPSTTQKQIISNMLENVATGEKNLPIVPVTNAMTPVTVSAVVPSSYTPMIPAALTSHQSLNINRKNNGFGVYSVFKDCDFHGNIRSVNVKDNRGAANIEKLTDFKCVKVLLFLLFSNFWHLNCLKLAICWIDIKCS